MVISIQGQVDKFDPVPSGFWNPHDKGGLTIMLQNIPESMVENFALLPTLAFCRKAWQFYWYEEAVAKLGGIRPLRSIIAPLVRGAATVFSRRS
jgi:hypothetical protein